MDELLELMEEQSGVGFTGKVNLLRPLSKQYFGVIVFDAGELISVSYKGLLGMKAFYKIFIDISDNDELEGIVEPEIVDNIDQDIHYPFSKLKEKLDSVIEQYKASKDQKPPDAVKLLVNAEFFNTDDDLSGEEFELMCTISDYGQVRDIYFHSKLLEYEVTHALVNLRKKGALKVVN